MTGTAQKQQNRSCQRLRIYGAAAFAVAILLYAAPSHANYVVARSGAMDLLTLGSLLPFLAAIVSYILAVRSKSQTPRKTKLVFLVCFAVPAILFCFTMLVSALGRSFNFWRIAEGLAIYLAIWAAINGAVYILYAQLMQLPQPDFRTFFRQASRLITWQRCLRAVYVLLLLGACYAVYPRAYFYYQVSKAEAGNLDKQLWVAKTYAFPYTKRFLGDRTTYITQSDAKARDWFEKAAAQKSIEAYNSLSDLYMHNYQLVRPGESRTHLEIARYWAREALDGDQMDRIDKLMAERPTKKSLYGGNNHATDFSTMSGSPVCSSGGWWNLFATICWLIGGGLLNIGIFYGLSRIINKRYHQHLAFVAVSWPIYICLACICVNMIYLYFDISNLSEYVPIPTIVTFTFGIIMLRYITILRRTPVDQQQAKAKRTAIVYSLMGGAIITFPFAVFTPLHRTADYILDGLYNTPAYSGYLNLTLTIGWIVSAVLLLWAAYCVRKYWRKAETLTKKEKIKSVAMIYIYILIATGLMALPSLLAESCYIH